MEIQIGAPVESIDGANLGKIDRVVFDPQTGETKSIVVRKGLILPRDVALPVDCVRVAAPSRIEVTLTEAQVGALPDFFEHDYVWPPDSWVAPYGWPMGAVLWPASLDAGFPFDTSRTVETVPAEAQAALQREAEHQAVIGPGAEVVSADGERVGEVHTLAIDPDTNRPSHLVVRRGVLFTEDVEVPSEWIDELGDHRVSLNVDKATLTERAKQTSD